MFKSYVSTSHVQMCDEFAGGRRRPNIKAAAEIIMQKKRPAPMDSAVFVRLINNTYSRADGKNTRPLLENTAANRFFTFTLHTVWTKC